MGQVVSPGRYWSGGTCGLLLLVKFVLVVGEVGKSGFSGGFRVFVGV